MYVLGSCMYLEKTTCFSTTYIHSNSLVPQTSLQNLDTNLCGASSVELRLIPIESIYKASEEQVYNANLVILLYKITNLLYMKKNFS